MVCFHLYLLPGICSVSDSVNRYPVLIDAVIQSNGIGFIGTDRSTMSEMAMRRCQTWHGGVTRTVKWGYIGADDH